MALYQLNTLHRDGSPDTSTSGLSAICIVKQENYQYPSKMNTSHDNIELLITALKDIQKHEQLN